MPQSALVPSLVASFALGVSATLAANYVLGSVGTPKDTTTTEKHTSKASSSRAAHVSAPSNTREQKESDLLDSPDLDLRLIRKAEAVIRLRSVNLTVVIERSTNMWNHSAVLRTAEALGIHNVFIIDPEACNDEYSMDPDGDGNKIRDKKNRLLKLSTEEAEERRQHHLFARNATEWLNIREFHTTSACIQALRETNHQIYATDLSQKAVELTQSDLSRHDQWPLPEKLAIVFGTEAVGVSEEMLNAADLRVYLPLRGFADSLNLSVAAALVIHHILLLQPDYVASISKDEQRELRKLWYPKLARQRLLSSKDKKRRRKLMNEISRMETLKAQQDTGVNLTSDQLKKIGKLEASRAELKEIEKQGKFDASDQIVQDLVDNPPEPLSDLRRADEARVTWAGKGVKKNHAEHWKGLAAVTNTQSENLSSAGYFRDRLSALGEG